MANSESQKRILVVEDESDLAQLYSLHLADAGYQVTACGNGTDGLAAAMGSEGADFDLLLLDQMLPGVDGLETRMSSTSPPEWA
jgi:two-component system, OmpR family, response regulator